MTGKEDAGESGRGRGNCDVPSRWEGRQKLVPQPVSMWSSRLTPTANTCWEKPDLLGAACALGSPRADRSGDGNM